MRKQLSLTMEITSKRHLFKFYLTLILVNAFFLILISIFQEYFKYNKNSLIIGGLILLAIAISINFGFIKNAPSILLDKKGIRFKNNFFWWNDLSSVKLTGKGGMIFTSGECATLTFNNSVEIQIFDDFYSNISEMKCFIQQIVIEKKDQIEFTKQDIIASDIDKDIFVSYKGNPLFSLLGIYLWVLILLLFFILIYTIKHLNINGSVVSTILILLLFSIFYRLMHYFELSTYTFCVRKHYFYWEKDYYNISDIRDIVIERQGKFSNRLRLITKDFETKLYPGVGLSDKTWLKMKKDLESKNITVRNENIYEYN
jgi:hypothetical protein